MRLYHFTAMMYLPRIIREGLTMGELPLNPAKHGKYCTRDQAVNLTTNAKRADHIAIWANPGGMSNPMLIDKTRLRIEVGLPDSEITTFRQFVEKYKPTRKELDLLVPYEHRSSHFFAFGGVRPEQFVDLCFWKHEEQEYESFADGIPEMLAVVEPEIERAIEFHTEPDGEVVFRFKDGGEDTFLLDGWGLLSQSEVMR